MRKRFRPYLAELDLHNIYNLQSLSSLKLQRLAIVIGLTVLGILVSGIFLSPDSAVLACGGYGGTCNQMIGRGIEDLFKWIFAGIFSLFMKGLLISCMLIAVYFGMFMFFNRTR